jgi:hypothetical protein
MSGTRTRVVAALIASAVVSLGWTGDGAARTMVTIPADLRINEIQVLGTHNSYHVEPRPDILSAYLGVDPEAIDLAYTHAPLTTQLEDQGIRQFELDLVGDAAGDLFRPIGTPGWKVLHIEQIDEGSTCPTLVDCLAEIEAWSADHHDHVLVTVLVEFKTPGEVEGGVDAPPVTPQALRAFDAEVRSVFGPDRLVTPDDVRGDHESLEAAVLAGSWPTVDEARGRVMFVLNDHRDEYVDGDPSLAGRVAFPNSTPGEPDAAFLLLNDPIADAAAIVAAVEAGYIVRTRADVPVATVRSGDTAQRDAAFASGAQFVSTDFPVPGLSLRWGTDYVAQLPGGGPARCNPVTAPPDCDAATIETM